ncbi:MAG: four helix bundle protein [Crocinitomicaceae bacterium]|nr:four helix bundle protein [Crocinitomicaceae bacterium]
MSKQFLRSGTAIGALFREAQHAESKKDFIHKLAIAQKEAHETIFWLDLLYETEYLNEEQYYDLEKQVTELFKMISSSIITTKTAVRKVSN